MLAKSKQLVLWLHSLEEEAVFKNMLLLHAAESKWKNDEIFELKTFFLKSLCPVEKSFTADRVVFRNT